MNTLNSVHLQANRLLHDKVTFDKYQLMPVIHRFDSYIKYK